MVSIGVGETRATCIHDTQVQRPVVNSLVSRSQLRQLLRQQLDQDKQFTGKHLLQDTKQLDYILDEVCHVAPAKTQSPAKKS